MEISLTEENKGFFDGGMRTELLDYILRIYAFSAKVINSDQSNEFSFLKQRT